MKKSKIYQFAMMAVIDCQEMNPETKVEILRVLFEDEKVAVYTEKMEETKNAPKVEYPEVDDDE